MSHPEAASDPQALPRLPDHAGEGVWHVHFPIPPHISARTRGEAICLNLTDEVLRQEIQDQCEIKKPARGAILRATEKRLAKAIKQGVPLDDVPEDHPQRKAFDGLRWDCFILFVDELIAGQHLALRGNDDAVSGLIASLDQHHHH